MVVALVMALKSYTIVVKGLKLKVRKFLGLIPTFIEVTGEKLVGGLFAPPPHPIKNRVNLKLKVQLRNTYTFAQHENSKM